MTLDELFQLEPEEIEQLFEEANISSDLGSWLEHDPEFLSLVQQSATIDEKAVLTYLRQGDSTEFRIIKKQQSAIRMQLSEYVARVIERH